MLQQGEKATSSFKKYAVNEGKTTVLIFERFNIKLMRIGHTESLRRMSHWMLEARPSPWKLKAGPSGIPSGIRVSW